MLVERWEIEVKFYYLENEHVDITFNRHYNRYFDYGTNSAVESQSN